MKKIWIILGVILILLAIGFIYLSYPYMEPKLYPRSAGIDKETGLPLEKIYFCMDICPMQGHVYTVYKGVDTVEECEEIGGKPLLTGVPSPGYFFGCEYNK